jgi:anti-sigma factor (TIGR02949 family)
MSARAGMNCRELIDFIADYLDGDLTPKDAAAFESHLAECRSCRAYLESYRATLRLERASARNESLDDAPEELIRAILAVRHKL